MTEGFLQRNNIVSAFVPVDLQTGANDGDWVSLANYERCLIVLFKGAGTDGDDPIFKLQQAKTNGGSAKDLDFTVIHTKLGTLTGIKDFTRNTQAADTSYVDTDSAQITGFMVVEIKASDLDAANGYTWLKFDVANIGSNAQLGCAFYIMLDARYKQEAPPDAIA